MFQAAQTKQDWIPVITIDGPTASGKWTLASTLATRLGYRFLDSGSLYRVTGLVVSRRGIHPDDHDAVTAVAREIGHELSLRFEGDQVWLADEDVSDALRQEEAGQMASRISAIPAASASLTATTGRLRRRPS